jgi:hypothetical protein
MYFAICPSADRFTYIVSKGQPDSEGNYDGLFYETYRRDEAEPITNLITNFTNWLKANDLWKTYIKFWGTT